MKQDRRGSCTSSQGALTRPCKGKCPERGPAPWACLSHGLFLAREDIQGRSGAEQGATWPPGDLARLAVGHAAWSGQSRGAWGPGGRFSEEKGAGWGSVSPANVNTNAGVLVLGTAQPVGSPSSGPEQLRERGGDQEQKMESALPSATQCRPGWCTERKGSLAAASRAQGGLGEHRAHHLWASAWEAQPMGSSHHGPATGPAAQRPLQAVTGARSPGVISQLCGPGPVTSPL